MTTPDFAEEARRLYAGGKIAGEMHGRIRVALRQAYEQGQRSELDAAFLDAAGNKPSANLLANAQTALAQHVKALGGKTAYDLSKRLKTEAEAIRALTPGEG